MLVCQYLQYSSSYLTPHIPPNAHSMYSYNHTPTTSYTFKHTKPRPICKIKQTPASQPPSLSPHLLFTPIVILQRCPKRIPNHCTTAALPAAPHKPPIKWIGRRSVRIFHLRHTAYSLDCFLILRPVILSLVIVNMFYLYTLPGGGVL